MTDHGSCLLNWRLFLSRSWDETHAESEENRNQIRRRRTRARIPDEIGHQPRADLALAMIDQLTDWGLAPPVVVADADYGENGTFRTALTTRGLEYIVQVKAAASMHPGDAVFEAPEYSGCGRPKKPGSRTKPIRAQVLAQSHPVSWRHGSRGTMTSRFATMRVRPANRNLPRNPNGTLPAVWLLAKWPSAAEHPSDH